MPAQDRLPYWTQLIITSGAEHRLPIPEKGQRMSHVCDFAACKRVPWSTLLHHKQVLQAQFRSVVLQRTHLAGAAGSLDPPAAPGGPGPYCQLEASGRKGGEGLCVPIGQGNLKCGYVSGPAAAPDSRALALLHARSCTDRMLAVLPVVHTGFNRAKEEIP
jgi:hypothetical protein